MSSSPSNFLSAKEHKPYTRKIGNPQYLKTHISETKTLEQGSMMKHNVQLLALLLLLGHELCSSGPVCSGATCSPPVHSTPKPETLRPKPLLTADPSRILMPTARS